MENYKELPQLGMGEAIKLASSRLTDFKGRSRRSEFWWWMLVVLVGNFVLSWFITNMLVSGIASIVVMFLGLAVTARRLQDVGKSATWVYASYGLGIIYQILMATSGVMAQYVMIAQSGNIDKLMAFAEENASSFLLIGLVSLLWFISCLIVFIFTLMDGKPETNKYGPSPKYVEA
ncbi:MAG: DUF805 domain-containing protein [Prevotella sp.]|nr:DUF805 domain-containing protein [Prevotella sp.]